jgi:hypothetical protein
MTAMPTGSVRLNLFPCTVHDKKIINPHLCHPSPRGVHVVQIIPLSKIPRQWTWHLMRDQTAKTRLHQFRVSRMNIRICLSDPRKNNACRFTAAQRELPANQARTSPLEFSQQLRASIGYDINPSLLSND